MDSHYVHMDRSFNENGVKRWIIFGLVYIALFVIYLCSKNSDVVTALYIPFDFFTSIALAIFYFYYKYLD